MSGVRGHNGYVLAGVARRKELSVAAITGDGDDVSGLLSKLAAQDIHPRIYPRAEEMIDAERPEIFTIAGPFSRNASLCARALAGGAHVFCEKPIALSIEELDRVREAFDPSRVSLTAMMGTRYRPEFFTAWRLVSEGEIGEVRLVNTQKSYKLGVRKEYFASRSTYGGSIPWVGSHAIDWILWFTGLPFRSVTALHSVRANGENGEMEATALCSFVLANEVMASTTIDFLRPETAQTHGDDRARVVGTAGVVEVRDEKVFLIKGDNGGTVPLPAECPRQIFCDLVDQAEGKSTSLFGTFDAFTTAEAYLNARRAADTGKPVFFTPG